MFRDEVSVKLKFRKKSKEGTLIGFPDLNKAELKRAKLFSIPSIKSSKGGKNK